MAISSYVIKSETDPDDVKVFLDDPKPVSERRKGIQATARHILKNLKNMDKWQ